jgi:hypothetical protein
MNLKQLHAMSAAKTINCVKPFLALTLVFILALLTAPTKSLAQKACFELFTEHSKIATNGIESSYKKYKKNNPTSKIDFSNYHPMFSTAELKDKMNPDRAMDRALMKPLGSLYDLFTDKKTKKTVLVKNKYDYEKIKNSTSEQLNRIKNTDAKKYESLINSAVYTEKLTENTTLVQITSIHNGATAENRIQQAISQRFQSLYINMVNWNYRVSNLMENKTLSSAIMTDDISVYWNELKYFDYTLTFDNKVWETQKLIIADKIELYNTSITDADKNRIIEELSQPTEAFLPLTGMAQAKSIYSGITPEAYALMGTTPIKYPVELKRYFKNDIEDPFNLLDIKAKTDDFIIRHKMIYKVIENLPSETPLEIHAHSILHVRAYSKFGFKDTGRINSEKYKNVDIHLLKASRETVMEKIKTILNTNQ